MGFGRCNVFPRASSVDAWGSCGKAKGRCLCGSPVTSLPSLSQAKGGCWLWTSCLSRRCRGTSVSSRALVALTHSSTKAAMAILLAAVVALIVANTGAHEGFLEFFHVDVVVGVGPFVGEMSLAHVINDIFMAIFFLLVGLEIKYEMTVGELTNIRQAALPIIAACGSVGPHCHLQHLQRHEPGNLSRLGRAHCHRHRFCAGHHGASGRPRAQRHPRILVHSGGGRRHYCHSGNCHFLWPEPVSVLAGHDRCGDGGAGIDESRPCVFAGALSAGGHCAMVLRVQLRRAFHHRRRSAGLHHPVWVPREPAHLPQMVGGAGAAGLQPVRCQHPHHGSGRLYENGEEPLEGGQRGHSARHTARACAVPVGVLRGVAAVCPY